MKMISDYARRACMLSVLCVMSVMAAAGCGGTGNDSDGPVLSGGDAALSAILNRMGTCLFDTGKFDDPTCKFD